MLVKLQSYKEKNTVVNIIANLRGLQAPIEGMVLRKWKMGEKQQRYRAC